MSIAIVSAHCAAMIKSSTTLKTTSAPKNSKDNQDIKVEISLTEGDKDGMAIINKIVLADDQIQMDADMVDAAKPLLDYMMQKSIDFISKQDKVSPPAKTNTNSSVKSAHQHTKPMSKKLLKEVIQPLMKIYLKDIPTESRRLIKSANKMVTMSNGIEGMNTTSVAGGPLKDGCTCNYKKLCLSIRTEPGWNCDESDLCNCFYCIASYWIEHSTCSCCN